MCRGVLYISLSINRIKTIPVLSWVTVKKGRKISSRPMFILQRCASFLADISLILIGTFTWAHYDWTKLALLLLTRSRHKRRGGRADKRQVRLFYPAPYFSEIPSITSKFLQTYWCGICFGLVFGMHNLLPFALLQILDCSRFIKVNHFPHPDFCWTCIDC
jgi:hypothetical protein